MGVRINISLSHIVGIGRQTYAAWRKDRTIRLGAGVSYYALFTMVPILALTMALAGQFFGSSEVEAYIADRLAQIGVADPDQTAAFIAGEFGRQGVRTSLGVIGGVSLLFASSLMFLALTDAVNVIWGVPVHSGVWRSIRRRIAAFVMVLVTSGVLVAEFAVSAVTGAAQAIFPGNLEVFQDLATILNALASSVALAGALTLMFRFLTPSHLSWRHAAVAGVATAALLAAGTAVIAWYTRTWGGSSIPGAFGVVLGVLTWVYVEAQILLAGVQLTKALTAPRQAA